MLKKAFIFFYLFFCLFLSHAQAGEKSIFLSVDAGKSRDGINVQRFGLQKEFTEWLKKKGVPLSGYFELSLNHWKGADEIFGVAFSPVFMVPLCAKSKYGRYMPYIEAGVGVSLISDKIIDNRNMSSYFQFENRIGLKIKIDRFDFHIRYMHYSNAFLAQPNDGIDILLAGIAFAF